MQLKIQKETMSINFDFKKLSALKKILYLYINRYDLDTRSFIPPQVYMKKKYVGYFSYNCKFWRKKYPNKHLKWG